MIAARLPRLRSDLSHMINRSRTITHPSVFRGLAKALASFALLMSCVFGVVEDANADITNTATASGDYAAQSFSSAPSSLSIPVAPAKPLIGVVKTSSFNDVNGNGVADIGDTLTYAFTVSNLGNVTLTNVSVTDNKIGAVTCLATTLAPAATTTCAGPVYPLTQADVDAGSVSNQATATGKAPDGSLVSDLSDPTTPGAANNNPTVTPLTTTPAIGLVKAVGAVADTNGNGVTDAGDKITYTFVLTNLGTKTLHGFTVTDSKVSPIVCPATPLAPAATVTCTGPDYVLTQADVDSGKVTNTATGAGLAPDGTKVTDVSDPTTPGAVNNNPTVTPIVPKPVIGLVKAAGAITDVNNNSVTDSGDKITYSFVLTNLGTVTLNGLAVTDSKVSPIVCPATPLAPGATATCTGPDYVLTQADVDAGKVTNTATGSGLAPDGTKVTDVSDSAIPGAANNNPTVTPFIQKPVVGLVKAAGTVIDVNANGKTDVGDQIKYTFTVSNLGNVTLTPIVVTDVKLGAVTCLANTLAPTLTTTCTAANYTLTQADIDAGLVSNTATVTATPPIGAPVTDKSDPVTSGPTSDNPTITPLTTTPVIGLVKVAGAIVDANANGKVDAGDTVAYTFTVSNLGTVTLNSIAVTDPKIPGITCLATTLAPGAATTCSGPVYTLTQADVNAGQASNQATVAAKTPLGVAVSDLSDPATAGPANNNPTVVVIPALKAIGIVKTGTFNDLNNNAVADLGDTITYAFTVSNLGNLPLTNVSVSDNKIGAVTCAATALAPGQSTNCTGPVYNLIQADIDAGTVSNQATATGKAPDGTLVSDLSDPVTPGASNNTPTDVTLPGGPAIGIVKPVATFNDTNNNGQADAGETLSYIFKVSNIGAKTLTNVTVTDPKVTGIICPLTTLVPAQATTCSGAPYVLTQADIDAGKVTNQATASGKSPSGNVVSDVSDPTTAGTGTGAPTVTPVVQKPLVGLVKAAGTIIDVNNNGKTDVGDQIKYTFTVSNLGNVTLTPIVVTDVKLGAVTCLANTLAPAATTTCSAANYTLTQADIDTSSVSNTATVTATPPIGPPVTDKSDPFTPGPVSDNPTVTPIVPAPEIGLVKAAGAVIDANGNGVTDAGDKITYSFVLTNLGNVTLHGLTVTDSKVSPIVCPSTSLAPGASATCTGPDYVIIQADLNAGSVTNTALGAGLSPSGTKVTDISDQTTPGAANNNPTVTSLAPTPSIGLVKVAGALIDTNNNGISDVGDTITYTFTVSNLGNVSLSNIVVTDPKVAVGVCALTSLAPGATTTCTSLPYALTQAEVDAGKVSNQAKVTANSPANVLVSDLSDPATTGAASNNPTVVTIPAKPTIGLVKTAGAVVDANNNGVTDAGDTITYTFTVSNIGNVSLIGVSVADPMLGAVICPKTTLAPAEVMNCTAAAYVLKQADLNAGLVSNQATATGTSPSGTTVADPSDPTTAGPANNAPTVVTLNQNAIVGLVKTAAAPFDANANGVLDAGDTIVYSFKVSNLGNVALTSVTVTDSKVSNVICPPGSLAPVATIICTGNLYVITQADMDAGKVINSAKVTGTSPNGTAVSDTSDPVTAGPVANAPTVTPLVTKPSMTLTKTDALIGAAAIGKPITYTFTVKNTGTVTLTNISITDAGAVVTGGPIASLAPGASDTATFTAAHVLTAADIASGAYTNTATVSGQPLPVGSPAVTGNGSVTTTLNSNAAMTFTKSGVLVSGNVVPSKAGDKATYTLIVTNTGPTPLFNVTVSDPLLASVAAPAQQVVALLDLAARPDAAQFATAAIDTAGTRSGIVAAANRGAHLNDIGVVTDSDALSVTRQIVRMSGASGDLKAGEKIGFLYSINNASKDTVSDIVVTQPDSVTFGGHIGLLAAGETDGGSMIFTREITLQEVLSGVIKSNAYVTFTQNGPDGLQSVTDTLALSGIQTYDDIATASISPAVVPQLDPGQSFTFTAPYTLTQADVDAGTVHNLATATAKDGGGASLIKSASFDLPLTQAPQIGLVKTGTLTPANGTTPQVGDLIKYKLAVTNLGNVTLKNVTLTDPPLTLVGGPIVSLAPGVTDSATFTAQYAITQADIDAGKYQNQATASGNVPGGASISATSDNADPKQHRPTITPIVPTAKIGLLKQVVKVVDTNNNGRNDVGDVIQYKFTVYNFGNVTLTNINITDTPNGGALVVIGGGPIASLAPGATSTQITGSYVITQADMDAGHVDNTATATGTAPDGSKVSHDSDPAVPTQSSPTVQPLVQLPQITLYKKLAPWDDVNKDGILDAGDVLHYTFTVVNPGNVTLTNLVLTDALAAANVQNLAPGATLAPGAVNTNLFTATYTVTAADEAAGFVKNRATIVASQLSGPGTASATSQNGDPVSSTNTTTDTAIQPTPSVAIELLQPTYVDTNGDGIIDAGDTLIYQVKVKNTGLAPLNTLVLADNGTGITVAGTHPGSLLPGQEDSISFTATHVLTAADVAAGIYNAQAKISATDANAPTLIVSDLSDPLDYTKNAPTPYLIGANPRITALKTFNHFETTTGVSIAAPATGAVVVYTITVANTGNVDFDNVTVAEAGAFIGTVTGATPFALAAGATDSTHFVVKHVLTNAEMLAGHLDNQILATGTNTAKKLTVTALSDPSVPTTHNVTITPLSALPGMAVVKSYTVTDINGNGINDAGDDIVYKFTVVNTGNINLTNITITDPQATLPLPVPVLATLLVGQTDTLTFTAHHLVTPAEAFAGSYSNQATFKSTELPAGVLSDKSNLAAAVPAPTVTPLLTAKPILTKVAKRAQVKRGEVVPFTITASNLGGGTYQLADIMPPGFSFVAGSAQVNGVAVVPVVNGTILTFNNLAAVNTKIILTLNLTAQASLTGGQFTNNARLIDQASNAVLAVAQATVEVIPDATFDCSDVIGRVFDDANGDGYMQDGEKGLAGVRIATVNGTLITTDAEGRFHVPCAAIPDGAIGSNFIMKIDPRSLPQGYKITTENPRVVRLTRGKVTEINFGATKTHDVKVDINGKAFDPNSVDLTEKWAIGVDRLVGILCKRRSELTIIYHQGGEADALALGRNESVSNLVQEAFGSSKCGYALSVKTSVEQGK